jgi:lysozyme
MTMNVIRRGAKYAAAVGLAVTIAITSLIKPWEGVKHIPYKDVGGVWTVCYGHTGEDVIPNKRYTQKECERLLEYDVARHSAVVDKYVTVEISPETRAALISFVFNVGEGAFKRSTLLKKLNSGNTIGACDELKRWNKVNGKVVDGLTNRRKAERAMCLKNVLLPV